MHSGFHRIARVVARHRALAAVTFVAALLVALPTMRAAPAYSSAPSACAFRTTYEYQMLEEQLATECTTLSYFEHEEERADLTPGMARAQRETKDRAELLRAAVVATDATSYYRALAVYYDNMASDAGNTGDARYYQAQALQAEGLARLEQPRTYLLPQTMPALVYLASNIGALLPLAAPFLPADGTAGYDGSLDFLLWIVPIIIAALTAAPSRMLTSDWRMGWLRSAAAGLLAAFAVTAPAAAITFFRNGPGEAAQPVVYLAGDGTVVATTVGAVVGERTLLLAGIAALVATLAIASHKVLHSRVPAGIITSAGVLLAAQPWYFNILSPVRAFASRLPTTYLDPSRATGAYQPCIGAIPNNGFGNISVPAGISALVGAIFLCAAFAAAARTLAHCAERWRTAPPRIAGFTFHLHQLLIVWRHFREPRGKHISRFPGDSFAHGPPVALRPTDESVSRTRTIISPTCSGIPPPYRPGPVAQA